MVLFERTNFDKTQYSEDQNLVPVIIVINPSIDHYHNVKLDLFNFCWMKIKETEKLRRPKPRSWELNQKKIFKLK